MVANGVQMILERITVSLSGLRHEIRNVYTSGLDGGDRRGDPVDQQIRQDAGVQTARPDDDQVGIDQGLGDFGHWSNRALERKSSNPPFPRRDSGLTADGGPVLERRGQVNALQCRGQDAARDPDLSPQPRDGAKQVPFGGAQRGEQKIPDWMAGLEVLAG